MQRSVFLLGVLCAGAFVSNASPAVAGFVPPDFEAGAMVDGDGGAGATAPLQVWPPRDVPGDDAPFDVSPLTSGSMRPGGSPRGGELPPCALLVAEERALPAIGLSLMDEALLAWPDAVPPGIFRPPRCS